MKIKDITVSRFIKLGLPSYSSDQLGATLTVDVEEGDKEPFKQAYKLLDEQIDHLLEEKGYNDLWKGITDKIDPEWIRKGS